jgi:hypothetical protein
MKSLLWIRITLMRIRNQDADLASTYHPDADPDYGFNLMRIRIRLFTLMWLRIRI